MLVKAVITGVVLGVLVSHVFLAPRYAINHMALAAKSGDSARLAAMIDVESVRRGFKQRLNHATLAEAQASGNAFAAAFVPAITNYMVDQLITPDMIAIAFRERQKNMTRVIYSAGRLVLICATAQRTP